MNATTEKRKLAWQIISAPLYRLIGPFLVAITILKRRRFLSLSNLQKLGQGNLMPTKARQKTTLQALHKTEAPTENQWVKAGFSFSLSAVLASLV